MFLEKILIKVGNHELIKTHPVIILEQITIFSPLGIVHCIYFICEFNKDMQT